MEEAIEKDHFDNCRWLSRRFSELDVRKMVGMDNSIVTDGDGGKGLDDAIEHIIIIIHAHVTIGWLLSRSSQNWRLSHFFDASNLMRI